MKYSQTDCNFFLLPEKGLPPLPEDDSSLAETVSFDKSDKTTETTTSSNSKPSNSKSLSFSSSSATKFKSNKRKATNQLDEVKFPENDGEKKTASSKHPAKKAKKEKKALLSFGDDA